MPTARITQTLPSPHDITQSRPLHNLSGSLALWLFPAIATIPAALAFRFSDADESEGSSPHVSYLPKLASGKTVRSIGPPAPLGCICTHIFHLSGAQYPIRVFTPHTTAPYFSEYMNTFALTAVASIALATGRLAAPGAYIRRLFPPHTHSPHNQPKQSIQTPQKCSRRGPHVPCSQFGRRLRLGQPPQPRRHARYASNGWREAIVVDRPTVVLSNAPRCPFHLTHTHTGLFLRNSGDRSRAIGYVMAQVQAHTQILTTAHIPSPSHPKPQPVPQQLLGAFAAASSAHAAFGADAVVGKVLPAIAAGATEGQAFGAEMLFVGLFLQSVMTFSGSHYSATTSNLAVTAALTAGLAAAGAVSGGALNPAIATALFLKNAAKDQARLLWLYWVRSHAYCKYNVVDRACTYQHTIPPTSPHHPLNTTNQQVGPCLGAALTAIVNKGASEKTSAIGVN